MRILKAADLYCGAGGTSEGAKQSGAADVVFAVNHWSIAVETHSQNFPDAKHVNSRIDQVNPGECGKIDLLFASPECTHHSRARGGRPTSDQQRSGAWDLMRWVEYHRPAWLVVENVREFEQWGPVHNGKPMESRRGAFFEAWVSAIRAAGYQVDWRVLNAADFGAATSRDRLFVIARKGRRNPVFPEPTHCQHPGGEFPGMALPKWRPAAEVIDWSLPCPSVFKRKRPLADKTLLRIEAGLRKFCAPFVAAWDQQSGGGGFRGIGQPIGTLVTKANMGLAVPFQVVLRNNQDSAALGSPLGTITAGGGHHGLAVPMVMSGLGGGTARPANCPTPTLTANGCCILITPIYLVHYYGNGNSSPVTDPLDTITTKGRHGLAMVQLLKTMRELRIVDIGFRLLQNHELSAAQGFPAGYYFAGNKAEVTRQIGNSVSPPNAKAITEAIAAA